MLTGKMPRIRVAALLLFAAHVTVAQETIEDSAAIIEPFPIVSYDTDTGFGYGAKVVFRNEFKRKESFDVTLFNSSKGERWYRLAFSIPDVELRQGKAYSTALDIVLDYDKWIKNSFFGIGRNSRLEDREYYTKEPLDISATFSRGFSTTLIGQLGVRYKATRNFGFQTDSRLAVLAPEINRSRASYVSLFTTIRYDTRDSYINPSSGVVVQGDAEYAPQSALGNVAFRKFACWLQYYSPLFHSRTIIALRLGLQSLGGENIPVQTLLSVGGNRDLRGSPQDRYLDRAAAIVNGELRFPILWRFGGVAGVDAGTVYGSFSRMTLAAWDVNPTLGLRLYMETFVVRLDVGFGRESTGFYLNFGHIF